LAQASPLTNGPPGRLPLGFAAPAKKEQAHPVCRAEYWLKDKTQKTKDLTFELIVSIRKQLFLASDCPENQGMALIASQ